MNANIDLRLFACIRGYASSSRQFYLLRAKQIPHAQRYALRSRLVLRLAVAAARFVERAGVFEDALFYACRNSIRLAVARDEHDRHRPGCRRVQRDHTEIRVEFIALCRNLTAAARD